MSSFQQVSFIITNTYQTLNINPNWKSEFLESIINSKPILGEFPGNIKMVFTVHLVAAGWARLANANSIGL